MVLFVEELTKQNKILLVHSLDCLSLFGEGENLLFDLKSRYELNYKNSYDCYEKFKSTISWRIYNIFYYLSDPNYSNTIHPQKLYDIITDPSNPFEKNK